MSTPWSSDQLPGPDAALFGSGKTKPLLETDGAPYDAPDELPEEPEAL
jgi:hypothetical protein